MTIGCYILTNETNGKKYVGQSRNVEKRIREHGYAATSNLIHKAIRKHGFSCFSKVVWSCSADDLDELEEFLIENIGTTGFSGYNLSTGGYGLRGVPRTAAHNAKIGQGNMGKVRSEETKEKLRLANLGREPANKGKTQVLTPEQKARHANAMSKLRKHKPTPLTKEQLAQYLAYINKGENHPMYGMPKSDETREKISASLMGNTPWNKGKPMSEESKLKLSASQKARLAMKGIQ
jgi:group I intron endonuclease